MLRGLGRLAESGNGIRPSPAIAHSATPIADYRQNIIRPYGKLGDEHGLAHDGAPWFAGRRGEIEMPGLNPFPQAASLAILGDYERDPACIEALGALNRWPGRTGVPAEDCLRQWRAS